MVVTSDGSNSSWCDGQGANTNVRCGGGAKYSGPVVVALVLTKPHPRYGHELSGDGRVSAPALPAVAATEFLVDQSHRFTVDRISDLKLVDRILNQTDVALVACRFA